MSRCYVGGLPPDPSETDLRDFFSASGRILDVQIKRTISNDWYAFVHFADEEGADEAVRRLDGTEFCGSRIRVELPFSARSSTRPRPGGQSRRPPPGGNRVAVRIYGVPPSGSWQDLKDHFREAGDCVFADVFGDGSGIVEYSNYEDAQRAVSMFDNSNFRSHQGESGRISLEIAPPPRATSIRSRPYEHRYSDERERERYPGSSSSFRDYEDEHFRGGSNRFYGPAREGRRGSWGGRSPPRRSSRPYGSGRRSPPPRGGGNDDDRYTTQDSRSTEAYTTSRASARSHGGGGGGEYESRRSPPRASKTGAAPAAAQESWSRDE